MTRSTLFVNNPSAYVHQIMDRVAGKPDFGDSWANKRLTVNDVPAAERRLVSELMAGRDTFTTGELANRLFEADAALQDEDKGIFGHGILGIGGGNHRISEKEQARAAAKNADVRPVLDYIYEQRGE